MRAAAHGVINVVVMCLVVTAILQMMISAIMITILLHKEYFVKKQVGSAAVKKDAAQLVSKMQ